MLWIADNVRCAGILKHSRCFQEVVSWSRMTVVPILKVPFSILFLQPLHVARLLLAYSTAGVVYQRENGCEVACAVAQEGGTVVMHESRFISWAREREGTGRVRARPEPSQDRYSCMVGRHEFSGPPATRT
jgi:hypothetical protein